jgi:hypothetical protein
MDLSSTAQQYLTAFGTALLLPLIWLMHRRGQHKVFPNFFVYLLAVLVKSLILQSIKPFSPGGYFYGYWTAEALTILLGFGVIFEIYKDVLTSGTLPISKATFFRMVVGLLLGAGIVALLTLHADGYATSVRIIFALSSTLRIVQVGLFALLAFFSIFYGLYWTGQAFGIALGYALFALAQLANTFVRAWAGPVGHDVYVYVSMLAYQCTLFIWLAYALKGKQEIRLENLPENGTLVWFGALERLAK